MREGMYGKSLCANVPDKISPSVEQKKKNIINFVSASRQPQLDLGPDHSAPDCPQHSPVHEEPEGQELLEPDQQASGITITPRTRGWPVN